jgi:hypothetical protein
VEFLAARAGAGPALELGVGTGRLAISLAALCVGGSGLTPACRRKRRAAVRHRPRSAESDGVHATHRYLRLGCEALSGPHTLFLAERTGPHGAAGRA